MMKQTSRCSSWECCRHAKCLVRSSLYLFSDLSHPRLPYIIIWLRYTRYCNADYTSSTTTPHGVDLSRQNLRPMPLREGCAMSHR